MRLFVIIEQAKEQREGLERDLALRTSELRARDRSLVGKATELGASEGRARSLEEELQASVVAM